MLEQLARLRDAALADLDACVDSAAIEAWRVRVLGRKGALTTHLHGLRALGPEERPRVGQAANEVKDTLERAVAERRAAIAARELEERIDHERLDVTLPGRPYPSGAPHPVTRTVDELCTIFAELGFEIAEGPEVEWEEYNFQMLNIPPDHPARDLWDTFWVTDRMLLRTHTSPNQIRIMERSKPPIRVLVPGRCYRYEAVSATNESIFFQAEGLMVDEHCTMADLKGVLTVFAHRMFGPERKVRFRATYYPFTEPSAAMDIDCLVCAGKGCRSCKYTGWLTILGSGMVHPKVLRGMELDADRYSGFAFGMGIERIAMLKYGIDDIRHFYANDLLFLKQFV